jgi:phosphatidyl-myo-inositol alpha-mannosyltransferase
VTRDWPRILFADQFGTMGGGQRILSGMVRRGVEKGWSVSVAAPAGPLTGVLEDAGARVYPLSLPKLSDVKSAGDVVAVARLMPKLRAELKRAIRESGADILHVNGARALLPLVSLRASVPFTYHVHTVQDVRSAWLTRSLLSMKRTSRVIAPSDFMARWACEVLCVPAEEVEVVGNWVDPEFVHYVGTPACDDAVGPERAAGLSFGVVGRVTAIKGQIDALSAVLAAREGGCRVTLVVVGEGDAVYVAELERAADADPEALELVGAVNDVPGLLRTLDAVIVPSLWDEPFGLAAAEAMACGTPVVAYASGALRDVVGEAGIVVPVGDVAGLRQAIEDIAEDAEMRRRLSERGCSRARERFDYETQTEKLFAVFSRLVGAA